MWRVGPGGKLLLVVMGLAVLTFTIDRYALHGALLKRIGLRREPPVALGVGDFPPGAAAPATDIVRVPTRPLRLLAMPRGSAASLLLAAGGTGTNKDAPVTRSYGLDVDLKLQPDERAIADALALGGDKPGGADAAVVSVDRLVQLRAALPNVRLKTVLLVSRSRGQEAIAAASGITQVGSLRGRKVAVPRRSPARFFLLWELAQASLSPSALQLELVESSADAARLLRESAVDAAAGAASDLAGPARERSGAIIATSADAPHLVATVLVVRAEFLARFPDAVRRLSRAVLDAADAVALQPVDAARLLSASAPQLGDPFEAIKTDPPSTLLDNRAFFDELQGDAPVRYKELYRSAADLWRKLGEPTDVGPAADSRELGPLMAVARVPPATSSLPPLRPPAPRPDASVP